MAAAVRSCKLIFRKVSQLFAGIARGVVTLRSKGHRSVRFVALRGESFTEHRHLCYYTFGVSAMVVICTALRIGILAIRQELARSLSPFRQLAQSFASHSMPVAKIQVETRQRKYHGF